MSSPELVGCLIRISCGLVGGSVITKGGLGLSLCLHLPHPPLLLLHQYAALSYFSSIMSTCVPSCQDSNYKLRKDVFKQRKVWFPLSLSVVMLGIINFVQRSAIL